MISPPDHDPALRTLLRRADPAQGLASPPPADFAAAVHARLADGDTAVARALRARALPRQLLPLAAALALLASLGAGSAVAYASHQRERTERYAAAFARSIDPWLMHADRASAPAHRH
jgi:hypothetical protein